MQNTAVKGNATMKYGEIREGNVIALNNGRPLRVILITHHAVYVKNPDQLSAPRKLSAWVTQSVC